MVVLATVATVIASQAVISGAFTVVHQASRLGLLPRTRIVHTSAVHARQIYLPVMNWLIAAAVLILVLVFRSSTALAAAYGIAVTATIVITASLLMLLQYQRRDRLGVRAVTAVLATVMLVFLAGTVPKIAAGGWLPLTLAAALVTVMTTWHAGRRRLIEELRRVQTPLPQFAATLAARAAAPVQTPGTGVFLTRHRGAVPLALALETMIDQAGVRPRELVLLSWSTVGAPTVDPDRRTEVAAVDGLARTTEVAVRFGYREPTDLVAALRAAHHPDGRPVVDPATAVFYLSVPVPVFTPGATMRPWRQRLFMALTRLAGDPATTLTLPRERAVVIGREISL